MLDRDPSPFLFRNRKEAGRQLARTLAHLALDEPVVVGLAWGGIPVAAAVAERLGLALDAVAVRKVRQPWQPEYVVARLRAGHGPVPLAKRTVLLVDDGLATEVAMVAAIRWARRQGATRVVVAIPVGAAGAIEAVEREADETVCLHTLEDLISVGIWYLDFPTVSEGDAAPVLQAFSAQPAHAA